MKIKHVQKSMIMLCYLINLISVVLRLFVIFTFCGGYKGNQLLFNCETVLKTDFLALYYFGC